MDKAEKDTGRVRWPTANEAAEPLPVTPLLRSRSVFTARCTLLQSAVLRSHVVRQSVCLSMTLVNCDHIGWNSSKTISPLVSLGRSLFATPT